jgi:hypothetical protein
VDEFEVILKRTLAMRAPFWSVIDLSDSSFLLVSRVLSVRARTTSPSTTADRDLVHSIVSSQILRKRERET